MNVTSVKCSKDVHQSPKFCLVDKLNQNSARETSYFVINSSLPFPTLCEDYGLFEHKERLQNIVSCHDILNEPKVVTFLRGCSVKKKELQQGRESPLRKPQEAIKLPVQCSSEYNHLTEQCSREHDQLCSWEHICFADQYSAECKNSPEQLINTAKRRKFHSQSEYARDFDAKYMKKCTPAGNQFNTFYANDRRVSILQKMEKAFICDICDHSFTMRNLKRHKKEGHSSTTVYFVCTEEACSATFFRRGYLRNHLKNVIILSLQ